jgi:hypothetical protein
MDVHEQALVASISARPSSSWPLVDRLWLCARARACTPQQWSIKEGSAAHAAQRIGKTGDSQLLASAGLRVNTNRTTGTPSIQYP